MLWMLCLFALFPIDVPNAEDAYRELKNQQAKERGYSDLTVDLRYNHVPVMLTLYPHTGCALQFSEPFDDTWTSDEESYSYLQWNGNSVIIKPVLSSDRPANLFFRFGENVIEVLVQQTDTLGEADRNVRIHLKGFPEALAETLTAIPFPERTAKVADEKTKPDPWLLPLDSQARHHDTVHGTIIYNFESAPFFLYFKPHDNAPPVTITEVIRGKKRRWSKGFVFEYPVPAEQLERDGRTLLLFDAFALGEDEKLYFRSQYHGERNARFTRLRGTKR